MLFNLNMSKTSTKNPRALKIVPYAYNILQKGTELSNKDYNKMLLTLSVVLQTKLKPIHLYNLHNALYLSLLAHKKNPSSMRSITYLERKTVLLCNCSTKDLLPRSPARELGKAGSRGASLLGRVQGGGVMLPGCQPGLQGLQRLGAIPAHTEGALLLRREAPFRAESSLPACLSTRRIPQRGWLKL